LTVAEEAASDFEDPHPLLLAVDVGAQRVDEPAKQRAAHHIEIVRDRVQDLNRIRIEPERAFRLRAHEAERDDLLVIAIDEALLEHRHRPKRFALREHRLRLERGRGGNVVVAIEPGDFLDEVLLDREVEAERRGRTYEIVALTARLELQSLENPGDGLRRDGDAEQTRDARTAHTHRIPARQLAAHIDQRAGDA